MPSRSSSRYARSPPGFLVLTLNPVSQIKRDQVRGIGTWWRQRARVETRERQQSWTTTAICSRPSIQRDNKTKQVPTGADTLTQQAKLTLLQPVGGPRNFEKDVEPEGSTDVTRSWETPARHLVSVAGTAISDKTETES
jgi:hypothetical protein